MGTCQTVRSRDEATDRIFQMRRNKKMLHTAKLVRDIAEDKRLREVVEDLFTRFDKNQDGYLDSAEVEEMVRHCYLSRSRNKPDETIQKAAERLAIAIS